jgi:hypothetical protein
VASASPHVIDNTATAHVRVGARHRLALFYAGVSVMVLVPGFLIKAGIAWPGDTVMARMLAALGSALADIQFGSGLRFWLGVTGATMMALLLVYPLRKVFSRTRLLGSVGGWFQMHILFGLLGPVCILYHCNFGHGSTNANVALWSMLLVALSGIAGIFVYGRASRDFYGTRQQALQHRDAILAALSAYDRDGPGLDALAAAFETFEAGLLTPRRGVVRCTIARLRLERSRLVIAQMITDIIEDSARRSEHSQDDIRRSKGPIFALLRRYLAVARAAASQSVREQIWARWRMFHMPVFLIMIVAASLHVIAVWDMGGPSSVNTALERRADADPGVSNTVITARAAETRDEIETLLRQDTAQSVAPRPPVLLAKPQLVTARPKPSLGITTKPVSVVAITARADQSATPGQAPTATTDAMLRRTAPALKPAAAVPPPTPVANQTGIEAVYAELQRREGAQPMALGGAKPRTLEDQIAALKSLRDNKQFFHSESETGFPLTGKHLKVECASCHTAPLRETRQPEPRACVNCHKNDDVHSGRRPDCAQCHTTNRWNQIVRRR